MILGVVNTDREATLQLRIFGTNQQSAEILVVIDTGFTGHLTLPAALIATLNLLFIGSQLATLADSSTLLLNMYTASVEWDGQVRRIEIDSAETTPLAGMALLYGHKITIEAVDGGQVIIDRM